MKAKWARHYKKRQSVAHPVIRRIRRQEEMAKRKTSAGETKKHASGRKKGAIELTPDKYFVLRSGTPIRSIEELAMMLDTISDEDFGHHVTESKNDFSTWINDVFGKKDLAESLLKTKDKKESQIVLLKHTTLKVK